MSCCCCCLPVCGPDPDDPCTAFGVDGINDATFESSACKVFFDLQSFTTGYSALMTISQVPCASGTEGIGLLEQVGTTTFCYTADKSENLQTIRLSFQLEEGECSDILTIAIEFSDFCAAFDAPDSTITLVFGV